MELAIDNQARGLTPSEIEQLLSCETVIQRNLAGFVEAGEAMAIIRDGRLYRGSHRTFEDYCKERWGIRRDYANKMIAASGVVADLDTMVSILPATERQARALAEAPEAERAAVWQEAVSRSDGKPAPARVVAEVIAERHGDDEDERARALLASIAPRPRPAAALHSSTSNEWYTPARYLDAVRAVMGAIDLDPASCEAANAIVGAGSFYDEADDGLSSEWFGRVFLNPPYGKTDGESNQAVWSQRLVSQFLAGNLEQAILLVNATTDRGWFKPLWDFPICFTDHRIAFYGPNDQSQPTHGNAFVYMGPHIERFAAEFSKFGTIATRLKLGA